MVSTAVLSNKVHIINFVLVGKILNSPEQRWLIRLSDDYCWFCVRSLKMPDFIDNKWIVHSDVQQQI